MRIETEDGGIEIPQATLVQIVSHAVASVEGARARRQRAIEVGAERVQVGLAVQRGRVLRETAAAAQAAVAAALHTMCGLSVASVDVTVEELE